MEQDVFIPEKDDVIQDPVLHWAVRSAMNKISSRDKLTVEDVGSEYVKYISFEQSNHPENFVDWEMPWVVESLEGLQYAKSAIQIDIGYTTSDNGKTLKSLKPISDLTQLRQLFLKYDGLTDISDISGLTNLTELWLDNNQIVDINAIKDMKQLSQLSLCGNQVEDINPLMGLENARTIDLSRNNIKTLPEDMSGLKNLMSLDLSSNSELADISSLSKISRLQRISLLSCNNVKDIKPLVELTALNKDETFLPSGFDKDKDDLFAAIDVNKTIKTFSISNMSTSDLTSVKKALDAYDALTDNQKSYLDEGKINAIRANYDKVKNGEEPDSYPEYENSESKTPIWDRIEIKVVNQNGAPISGMNFIKEGYTPYASDKRDFSTDENGMLVLKHTSMDPHKDEIKVYAKGNESVTPEIIRYTVSWGGPGGPNFVTETVNGKKATGTESLQFVVREADLDKALEELETLVNKVESSVCDKESFRYTNDSWKAYEANLLKAKGILKSKTGTIAEIQKTTTDLQNAFDSLKKADHLTALKLTVRDKDGKHIGRKFKFQIRDANNHNHAWNEWSSEEDGVAYINVSPGWTDDTTWEIVACVQESMDMEPITVTTGKEGSKWYFKTIDGKDASVDFEKVVKVWPKESKPGGGETPSPGPGGGSESGGGSGGSAGGGGGAPSAPVTPSKDSITNSKDDSGSITTDVKLVDKVTSDNGNADAKIDKELADKVVENVVSNKSESVGIDASTSDGNAAKTEITLSAETYKDIAGKTDAKKITIKTDNSSVSMDRDSIIAIAEQVGDAESVKLVIETKETSEDRVVIELKLVTSNGEIHDFKGGKVTVTVPVKNTFGKKLVAVYIDESGKYTKVGGELTADGKAFVFETGHFSTYAVMTEEAADAAIKAQEPEQPAKPVVKSVAITSVKAQEKAMKVTWKKSADKVNGYQVRYSTSKSFKTSKTLSVKYTKKVNSRVVKNLKSGKRYYVKVRTYVKNADGTYYSKWSKVKSVKIK